MFTQDAQHKIKEHFRSIPDEFMTSEMASKAKVQHFLSDNFWLIQLRKYDLKWCIL